MSFGLFGLSSGSALTSSLAVFLQGQHQLAKLSFLDVIVIAIYFAMVIWIGFYLKQQSNTGEEFFMAGREMTAWIAGLSFVSANLGSLELMGWAGSAYQYGILATHWYWIGAIPGHALSGPGDDAVLLHLQDAFGARLSEACATARRAALGRHLVCLHDRF